MVYHNTSNLFLSCSYLLGFYCLGFVALFTLPKVYENNKTQIDQNIEVVRRKIAELTNKWELIFLKLSHRHIITIDLFFVLESELLFQLERKLRRQKRKNKIRVYSLAKPIYSLVYDWNFRPTFFFIYI